MKTRKTDLASSQRDLNVKLKNLYFIPKSIFSQFHNILLLTVRVILQKGILNQLIPVKTDLMTSFCSLNKVPVLFKVLSDLVLLHSDTYSSARLHKSHKCWHSLFFLISSITKILLPFQGIFFLYPHPTSIHLRNSYPSFKNQ